MAAGTAPCLNASSAVASDPLNSKNARQAPAVRSKTYRAPTHLARLDRAADPGPGRTRRGQKRRLDRAGPSAMAHRAPAPAGFSRPGFPCRDVGRGPRPMAGGSTAFRPADIPRLRTPAHHRHRHLAKLPRGPRLPKKRGVHQLCPLDNQGLWGQRLLHPFGVPEPRRFFVRIRDLAESRAQNQAAKASLPAHHGDVDSSVFQPLAGRPGMSRHLFSSFDLVLRQNESLAGRFTPSSRDAPRSDVRHPQADASAAPCPTCRAQAALGRPAPCRGRRCGAPGKPAFKARRTCRRRLHLKHEAESRPTCSHHRAATPRRGRPSIAEACSGPPTSTFLPLPPQRAGWPGGRHRHLHRRNLRSRASACSIRLVPVPAFIRRLARSRQAPRPVEAIKLGGLRAFTGSDPLAEASANSYTGLLNVGGCKEVTRARRASLFGALRPAQGTSGGRVQMSISGRKLAIAAMTPPCRRTLGRRSSPISPPRPRCNCFREAPVSILVTSPEEAALALGARPLGSALRKLAPRR